MRRSCRCCSSAGSRENDHRRRGALPAVRVLERAARGRRARHDLPERRPRAPDRDRVVRSPLPARPAARAARSPSTTTPARRRSSRRTATSRCWRGGCGPTADDGRLQRHHHDHEHVRRRRRDRCARYTCELPVSTSDLARRHQRVKGQVNRSSDWFEPPQAWGALRLDRLPDGMIPDGGCRSRAPCSVS
jgi:hypothetical protein